MLRFLDTTKFVSSVARTYFSNIGASVLQSRLDTAMPVCSVPSVHYTAAFSVLPPHLRAFMLICTALALSPLFQPRACLLSLSSRRRPRSGPLFFLFVQWRRRKEGRKGDFSSNAIPELWSRAARFGDLTEVCMIFE